LALSRPRVICFHKTYLLHGTIVVAMKVDWGRRTAGIALYCTVSPNLGWIS
jgi:hypothetical protein